MNHYLEISLRPDPEFGPGLLMSALFSKLHRALAKGGSSDIGVSFPGVALKLPALGDCLRMHGELPALQRLMATDWLVGMKDHILVGEVRVVPPKVSYRTVARVQAKSSAERLRRRQMRRHGLNEAEARERIPDSVVTRLKLPFVSIRSQSTNQMFRLFIEHGDLSEQPRAGDFSSYGLSSGATIPWF